MAEPKGKKLASEISNKNMRLVSISELVEAARQELLERPAQRRGPFVISDENLTGKPRKPAAQVA